MSVVLEVSRVSKSYGPRKALDEVDLQLERGEFVALLGPNGAGKTTLFSLLTGLFVASEGAILIEGHDIRRHPVQALAGIGVVFQQPTLDLDLSVLANLRFHCRLHGLTVAHARQRMAQELARLELSDRAADSARSLSGGNRRKVELARSLLHEPAILLMDEATVGLDPASRSALVGYVRSLCDERALTVLWATHLVDEAEQANRVVILHEGRKLIEGAPGELVERTGATDLGAAFLSLTGKTRQDNP